MAVRNTPAHARVSRKLRKNLTASAAVAALACAFAPAVVVLAPDTAKAQEQCGPLPLAGSLLCPTGPYPTGIDYTTVAGDILLDLAADAEVLETVILDATGDVVLTAEGDTLITSDTGEGLVATAGDTVLLTLDAVETTADGAEGVLIDAGGDVDLVVDSVLTSGDDADAVEIDADGGIAVTANTLQTSGGDSEAVELFSLSGPVVVGADLVETFGDGSTGILTEAAGDTDVSVGVLRTEGFEAAGLDLSADPVACAVLIAGSCDTTFTVGELTTDGDLAPGALVRAAGDITADVGILRTGGDEAAGLDLATDPDACVVLGAGACDTSFVAGDLLTTGLGSTGVLVRGAGDVTGDVGVLRTEGDDAAGLDIASDPGACILLGAGACDVDLGGGAVETTGDGATGVLVRAAGDVVADFTAIDTEGDNANALDIAADPAVCLVIGAGACGVAADVDDVDTDGDGSDGVVVDSPGPIDVDVGDVDTGGDDAEGIRIEGGLEPVTVAVDTVTTAGADAEGVEVTADGDIDVAAGAIVTLGPRSEGVLIDGGAGPVTVDVGTIDTAGVASEGVDVAAEGDIDVMVGDIDTTGAGSDGVLVGGATGEVMIDVGPVTTTGADADGVNTTTTTGAQVILTGDVTAAGAGSDGVDAASVSGDLDILVGGDITADDDAVAAATDGSVDITVAAGADVFGGGDGLDLTSGDGTNVVNNGTIDADAGFAIDIDGAGSMTDNNGTVMGAVDLTAGDDVFVNDGLFEADADSAFGAGTDLFTNNGEVDVTGEVAFTDLESLVNDGLIDMIDDAADDSLTLPGDFTGEVDSELAVDVALGDDGTPSDVLVVGGDVDGTTTVIVNNISDGPGVLNPDGVVIVDVDGAVDGDFVLDGGPITDGFIDFDLDTDGGDVLLVGSPNQSVFEIVRTAHVAQEFWYASADAWNAGVAGAERGDGARFWGQFYGSDRTHDGEREVTAFDVATTRDLSYDRQHYGYQMGADWGGPGGFFGVTSGVGSSQAQFEQTGHSIDLTGYNIGVYGGWRGGGLRADVLAKLDLFEGQSANSAVPFGTELEGRSWGVQGDIGYRFGSDFYVEPQASLAYVSTDLDGFEAAAATIEYDEADSMRGKAGVRAGWNAGAVRPFAAVHAVHEFEGENGVTFSSGGFDLALADEPDETYGVVTLGADATITGVDAFVQGEGAFGDVEGWGLRFGIRANW